MLPLAARIACRPTRCSLSARSELQRTREPVVDARRAPERLPCASAGSWSCASDSTANYGQFRATPNVPRSPGLSLSAGKRQAGTRTSSRAQCWAWTPTARALPRAAVQPNRRVPRTASSLARGLWCRDVAGSTGGSASALYNQGRMRACMEGVAGWRDVLPVQTDQPRGLWALRPRARFVSTCWPRVGGGKQPRRPLRRPP
jgi:hypothetical protein